MGKLLDVLFECWPFLVGTLIVQIGVFIKCRMDVDNGLRHVLDKRAGDHTAIGCLITLLLMTFGRQFLNNVPWFKVEPWLSVYLLAKSWIAIPPDAANMKDTFQWLWWGVTYAVPALIYFTINVSIASKIGAWMQNQR